MISLLLISLVTLMNINPQDLTTADGFSGESSTPFHPRGMFGRRPHMIPSVIRQHDPYSPTHVIKEQQTELAEEALPASRWGA